MEIIGYCINEIGCYNSNNEFSKDVVKLLLSKPENTIGVFSDIDDCVAHLVNHLNVSSQNIKYLLTSQNKMCHLLIGNLSLQYYPGKHFLIGVGWISIHNRKYKLSAQFSNASQYEPKLKEVSNKNGYVLANQAKEVCSEVNKIYERLGFEVSSLVSPVNAFRKSITRVINLPKLYDIPNEAGWMALQSCKGGWCEAFQLGHFQNVYDYDINSSYPAQAMILPDVRDGTWVQSNKRVNGAILGYAECDFKIEKEFSPVTWQSGANITDKNFTPKGEFPEYAGLKMLNCIDRNRLGDFKIKDGWWWIPGDYIRYPLANYVKEFFQRKKEARGLEKEVIKTILVGGFYGLFLQTFNDVPSVYYFPPYASEIQTGTRVDVFEQCIKEDVVPLHIAVDGVITNKEFNSNLGREIGEWKLSGRGNAIIVSSGVKCIQGEDSSKEFAINYDWLRNEIQKEPSKNTYEMSRLVTLSLPLAWIRNKMELCGKVVIENRHVNIGIENKRMYEEQAKNGGELISGQLKSKAWNAKLLMQLHKLANNKMYNEFMINSRLGGSK